LATEHKYDWYGLVGDNSLSQGDIFPEYPLYTPVASAIGGTDYNADTIPVRRDIYDIVVLSQSCDLERPKVRNVLVCPIQEFGQAVDTENSGIKKKDFEQIRKGYRPAYHLLEGCELDSHEFEAMLINFGMIATTHYDTLKAFAGDSGERVRLLPPYREHLSQAFARFIMRVGLPQDIGTAR
jgi:hypothetical protein